MSDKPRDKSDFILPIVDTFSHKNAHRVGRALDAAVIFGVLEYINGNPSLQDPTVLEERYAYLIANLYD